MWRIEDFDFGRIDKARIDNDESAFVLVACASFIESGAELYTRNLIEFFAGDAELVDWLSTQWEPDEMRHGLALRTYVEHVWPEFAWASAFESFFAEYGPSCRLDQLELTPALELAARCVVETGTVAYYRALSNMTKEPLLHDLANAIADDELRHYKQFLRHFKRYSAAEGTKRHAVASCLVRQLAAIKQEDTSCATRHVLMARYPDDSLMAGDAHALYGRAQRTLCQHIPIRLAVRMLLQPLALKPALNSLMTPVLIGTAKMALSLT
jgi:hypothetical protein